MVHLRFYILIVDLILGIGAFAALFNSSFGLAEKTFLGLSLLLLAFMIEVYSLQSDSLNENYLEGIFTAIQILEKRIEGQDVKMSRLPMPLKIR